MPTINFFMHLLFIHSKLHCHSFPTPNCICINFHSNFINFILHQLPSKFHQCHQIHHGSISFLHQHLFQTELPFAQTFISHFHINTNICINIFINFPFPQLPLVSVCASSVTASSVCLSVCLCLFHCLSVCLSSSFHL